MLMNYTLQQVIKKYLYWVVAKLENEVLVIGYQKVELSFGTASRGYVSGDRERNGSINHRVLK